MAKEFLPEGKICEVLTVTIKKTLSQCPHCRVLLELQFSEKNSTVICAECGNKFAINMERWIKDHPDDKTAPAKIDMKFPVLNFKEDDENT